jgi:O-antigen/teichoic acid export membrane protein
LAQFMHCATGPVGAALLMSSRERAVLWINLPIVVVRVGLNYLAINSFGTLGAAWVSLFCVTVTNGCYWYVIIRDKKSQLRQGSLRNVNGCSMSNMEGV